jgi:hypothetical protein
VEKTLVNLDVMSGYAHEDLNGDDWEVVGYGYAYQKDYVNQNVTLRRKVRWFAPDEEKDIVESITTPNTVQVSAL